jgi:hypothetical protein
MRSSEVSVANETEIRCMASDRKLGCAAARARDRAIVSRCVGATCHRKGMRLDVNGPGALCSDDALQLFCGSVGPGLHVGGSSAFQ